MKIALIIAVLRMSQAITSSGLTRSLAELTAFVLVTAGIGFNEKRARRVISPCLNSELVEIASKKR